MKKIFTVCAAASLFFAACNNADKDLETKKDVVLTDTTGMYHSNASTDIAKNNEVVAPPQAEVKTITKIVYVDRTPRTVRHQTIREANPVQTQPISNVPDVNTTGNSNNNNNTSNNTPQPKAIETGNGTSTGTTTDNNSNTSTTTAPVEKKKGWSNAAKDATIGGVGGGVFGAVLSKNKVKGAVIGGILGAAGGYILGKKKDKKDAGIEYADYTNQ